jgi:NADH dehydrogenase FAD-containing subunit
MKTLYFGLCSLILFNVSYGQNYLQGARIELRTTPSRLGAPMSSSGLAPKTSTQQTSSKNVFSSGNMDNCPDGKCFNLAPVASADADMLARLIEIRAAILKLPNFNKYPQLTRANADLSDLIGRIKVKQNQ